MKNAMIVPLKTRLRAWWEGYEVEDLLPRQQEQTLPPAVPLSEKPLTEPLAAWETPEIRMMQLIWGAGYHKPGGPDYILGLVKPFGLDPSKSMMDFGAGLGGAARTIANEFGVWVTGYEADASLVKAGKQMSLMAGLDRRADIARYFAHDFDLHPNTFDCILSSETLFRIENKYHLLEVLQHGLKAKGQLTITDFVLGEGVAATDPRLRDLGDGHNYFWQVGQYEQRFRELSLDLRVAEDITHTYRHLILNGWSNFAKADPAALANARAYPAAILGELETWTKRVQALESGLLRVVRFYAIKKNTTKLMSDW